MLLSSTGSWRKGYSKWIFESRDCYPRKAELYVLPLTFLCAWNQLFWCSCSFSIIKTSQTQQLNVLGFSTMLDSNGVPSVIELTLLQDSWEVSTREVLTALSAVPTPNITRGWVFYSIFPLLVWVLDSDFHFCQAKEDIFYHNGFTSDVYRPTQTGYYTLKNCTSGTILLELVFTSNNTS